MAGNFLFFGSGTPIHSSHVCECVAVHLFSACKALRLRKENIFIIVAWVRLLCHSYNSMKYVRPHHIYAVQYTYYKRGYVFFLLFWKSIANIVFLFFLAISSLFFKGENL